MGGQSDTLGAMNLEIHVGPVKFVDEFHVMDIAIRYIIFLGMP